MNHGTQMTGRFRFSLRLLPWLVVSLVLLGDASVHAQDQLRELKKRANDILAENEISQQERFQRLRNLLDQEEAKLRGKSIKVWISQLGDSEFDTRQNAQQNLIDSGAWSIPEVTQAAQGEDREQVMRCLAVLAVIAKRDDREAASKAREALKQLALCEPPTGGRAEKTLAEIDETDEDRAIEMLKLFEARIYPRDDGPISSVSFFDRRISAYEVSLLSSLSSLRSVSFSEGALTERAVKELSNVKNLHYLSISGVQISDAGLANLAMLKNLTSLTLNCESITLDNLNLISSPKTLRTLNLQNLHPTMESVEILNKNRVRGLTLSLRELRDDDLQVVAELAVLKSLSIVDSPNLSDEAFSSLSKSNLERLTVLSLDLTDEALRHIGRAKSLTMLQVQGKGITDRGMEHLTQLKKLSMLMLISTNVTKERAEKLKTEIPSLRRVYQ